MTVIEADDELDRIGTCPEIPSTMRTMSGAFPAAA